MDERIESGKGKEEIAKDMAKPRIKSKFSLS